MKSVLLTALNLTFSPGRRNSIDCFRFFEWPSTKFNVTHPQKGAEFSTFSPGEKAGMRADVQPFSSASGFA
jgi:hypothetical protein